MQVSINQAADALNISTQTVRRRLAKGLIQGTKLETAQGYRWLIDIPDHQQDLSQTNGNALLEFLRECPDVLANEHIILKHFSMRYDRKLILNVLKARLPKPFLERVHILV